MLVDGVLESLLTFRSWICTVLRLDWVLKIYLLGHGTYVNLTL